MFYPQQGKTVTKEEKKQKTVVDPTQGKVNIIFQKYQACWSHIQIGLF